MAESDLPKRLREYSRDDHERGCQGRNYDCTCGYDDKRDPLLEEAAARIEQLEKALREILKMEVYGFAITSPLGGDVVCEGTNRFARESDMVELRRIARAALGEKA